jgi:hypothetical protein
MTRSQEWIVIVALVTVAVVAVVRIGRHVIAGM